MEQAKIKQIENEQKAIQLANEITDLESRSIHLKRQEDEITNIVKMRESEISRLSNECERLLAKQAKYTSETAKIDADCEQAMTELTKIQEEIKEQNQKANANVDWSVYM